MNKYRRLSPVIIKDGTKRPEVIMLQEALVALGYTADASDGRPDVGSPDGWAGKKTDTAIRHYQMEKFGSADGQVGKFTWMRLLQDAEEAGWKPPLERRIHAVICYYENATRQNSYGSTSLLSDGAGVNYGVLQHNRFGSLVQVLRDGGRNDLVAKYRGNEFTRIPEIAFWMQTPDGVAAQNGYFTKTIMRIAYRIADQMPTVRDFFKQDGMEPYWERFILMLADTVTQNGGLWSPSGKPFWRTITPAEAQHVKYRELYYGKEFDQLGIMLDCNVPLSYAEWKARWYKWEEKVKAELGSGANNETVRRETNKRAMIDLIEQVPTPIQKLIVMAQWRARSSAAKWWTPAVESRRMLDSAGVGVVNGGRLNLEDDFGFMDDDLFGLENPYEE